MTLVCSDYNATTTPRVIPRAMSHHRSVCAAKRQYCETVAYANKHGIGLLIPRCRDRDPGGPPERPGRRANRHHARFMKRGVLLPPRCWIRAHLLYGTRQDGPHSRKLTTVRSRRY